MLTVIFIFHLLGILSMIDAVMTTRTSQGAIAWAASLVMMPYIAVPAYWVLGRSKFEGFAEARRENEGEIEELLAHIVPQLEATFVPQKERIPEYEAMMNLSQLGMTANNHTQLLIDGQSTYDDIIEGIAKAQKYVLVEFYIVRDDGIGRRLKDALIERAKQGVKVHFVYDEIGSKDLPSSYNEELQASGVEIYPFNTTRGWRNRFQLNFRNHRKIVVVDGQTAWVGGLNVGDDYLGMNPKLSPWRDTHMRIEGPAALQVQVIFLSDWYWATRRIPELEWVIQDKPKGDSRILMLASSPAQKLETAGLFFTHAINSARRRIWISTPYFIPDESLIAALQLAALRGVDVRIITPRVPDNFLIKLAAYFYMEELSGLGIQFYEFNKGFSHQKVMLIDDEIATVGTANFDIRSFRLNFEITAFVKDIEFADEVETMLENDIKNSIAINLDEIKAMPYWRHATHRIARLFSPVL